MSPSWFASVLAAVGAACSGGKQVIVRPEPPPAWVDQMPKRGNLVCAVGYSGPTLYQTDCLKSAAHNGRGALAETISATIKTITIDISDGTRGTFSRDTFVAGSETAADAVLRGSEVESQWVDRQGQRGAVNGCYTLVCIDPSKPIDSFVEKLPKEIPKKTVEQVRVNAAAAFEELEREEAKRQTLPPPASPPAAGGQTAPASPAPAGGQTAPAAPPPAGGQPAPAAPAPAGGQTAPAAPPAAGGQPAPASPPAA